MTIYHCFPAYVYKITFLPTGQFYFGFRKANIKANRFPEDDLWIHYYSSSNKIKELLSKNSLNDFLSEIIYKGSPEESYWVEQMQIKNNWGDKLLLNRYYQDPDSGRKKAFLTTEESINKSKMTRKLRNSHSKGHITRKKNGTYNTAIEKSNYKKRITGSAKLGAIKGVITRTVNGTGSAGALKAISTKREKGINVIAAKKSWETRRLKGVDFDKRSETRRLNRNPKNRWKVIDPSGNTFIFDINGLKQYCKEQNLSATSLKEVANKRRSSHRRYKCDLILSED